MQRHVKFVEVAEELIKGNWGRQAENVAEEIKALDNDARSVCLLIKLNQSVLKLLRKTNRNKEAEPDDPADGIIEALNVMRGKRKIPGIRDLICEGLSYRAINVIRRGGFVFMDELTRDALMEVKGCGYATTEKIVAWKESLDPDLSELTDMTVDSMMTEKEGDE